VVHGALTAFAAFATAFAALAARFEACGAARTTLAARIRATSVDPAARATGARPALPAVCA
jgi:hypothetical protein